MKTIITTFILGLVSFFTPVAIPSLILMLFICMDTVVKLFALKTIAIKENKRYLDVFHSKILRKKFILKSFGYLTLVVPIAVLDIYLLTPFLHWVLNYYWQITVSIQIDFIHAMFTNILLTIFCLMELSSINENWDLLSGNNIFESVRKTVINIRKGISNIVDFIVETKKIKDD